VRADRHSIVVVMPQYRTDLVTRKLTVAADAMRSFPGHPSGERCWLDRVLYEQDGQVQTLAEAWPDGGPPWVRLVVGSFRVGTCAPVLPLMRLIVALAGVSRSQRLGPAAVLEARRAGFAATPHNARRSEDHAVAARVSDGGGR